MKTKTALIIEWIEKNGIVESQSHTARLIYQDNPTFWLSPDTVRSLLRNKVLPKLNGGARQPVISQPAPPPVDDKPMGAISEKELRDMYDIRAIVINALNAIKEGEFWRESDFVRRYLSGKSGYRGMLDSQDAMPYKGKASGQVFYGHPRNIEKLKHEGVLL